MRTTVTLERDIAESLEREVRRTGKTFKETLNEALRIGLGGGGKARERKRFVVDPHAFGFKAGVDLDRMNQLADELEAEASAARMRR